ncbi:MAG: trigger factor, partial [Planctomycetes bacterium]|nr:trigger factor [Planctomycetota bacterium]
EVKKGEAFSFSLNAEVRPEFDLPNYKDLEFSSREPSVDDKEVDIFVRNIQISQGELNDLGDDDTAQAGDMLSGDFSIYVNDERVAGRPNGNLEVGGDTILGVDVPEAAKEMVGLKVSELPVDKSFKVNLPANFPLEKYVGQDAEIRITVREVKRPDAPELDDELAKAVGYESLSEMREKAREIIESEKKNQSLQDLDNRIVAAVVDATELTVPPRFAEKQLSSILQREAFRMYQEGVDEDAIKDFIEKRREELPATIEKEMKESFVLEAIAKKERVFVTEEEIVRHIQQIAYMRGDDPNRLIEYFVQQNMIPQIGFDLRAGKTKLQLRKRAKVTYLDSAGNPLPEKEKKAKKSEAKADEPAASSDE